jgi:hypothetical protein
LLKHKIEWRALPVQNLSSISRVQQKVRRGEREKENKMRTRRTKERTRWEQDENKAGTKERTREEN